MGRTKKGFICFKLSMPGVASWNGSWSGADACYYIVGKYSQETIDRVMEGAQKQSIYEGVFIRKKIGETSPIKDWGYRFGDGWVAAVTAEVIDEKEAKKRKRKSAGFCGYGWMVESIIKHGDIRLSK